MEVITLTVGLKEVAIRNLVKNVTEFHRGICIPSTSGQRVVSYWNGRQQIAKKFREFLPRYTVPQPGRCATFMYIFYPALALSPTSVTCW